MSFTDDKSLQIHFFLTKRNKEELIASNSYFVNDPG